MSESIKNRVERPRRGKRTLEERAYEVVGIRAFKYRIPQTGDRDMRRTQKRHIDLRAPLTLGSYKEFNESSHIFHVTFLKIKLPALLVVLGLGLWSGHFSLIAVGGVGLALTVLYDVYPIMVQRYNYLRMKRLGLWKDKAGGEQR